MGREHKKAWPIGSEELVRKLSALTMVHRGAGSCFSLIPGSGGWSGWTWPATLNMYFQKWDQTDFLSELWSKSYRGLEGLLVFHFWFCGRLIFFEGEIYLIYPVFSIKEIDILTGQVTVATAAGKVIKKSNFSFFPKAPVPKLDGPMGLKANKVLIEVLFKVQQGLCCALMLRCWEESFFCRS